MVIRDACRYLPGSRRSVPSLGYYPPPRTDAFKHVHNVLRLGFACAGLRKSLVDHLERQTHGASLGDHCKSGVVQYSSGCGPVIPFEVVQDPAGKRSGFRVSSGIVNHFYV